VQGEVLLEVHNTQHFQAFLAAVRGALQDGMFAQYHAWFNQSRHQGQQATPYQAASQSNEQVQQPCLEAGVQSSSVAGKNLLQGGPQGGEGVKRPTWTRGEEDGQRENCRRKQSRNA